MVKLKAKEGLYFLKQFKTGFKSFVGASTSTNLWHQRLGHTSFSHLKCIAKNYLNLNISSSFDVCETCHFFKQHRLSFPKTASTSKDLFALIHMDVWGNFSTPTCDGQKYFLTLVDDYFKYTWVYIFTHMQI